jgi:hypothetical protein
MEELLNQFVGFVKPFIMFIITAIVSVCSPIQDVIYVLFFSFLFNIITGIVADVHVNKSVFNLKKAFSAFFQMALVMALVYYVHSVFEQLKMDAIGHEIIKWIAILAVYFYTTNIARNSALIYPKNKLFAFIYELLTTQIFARIKNALFMDLKN